ncbi:hypothetical protein BJ875DRAFT_134758 [Amylocarpus encephaloides]|uniref:ABM domain-containing protein n=1 Tax=Amylocarpus encephaloides TaxID=45428 RepID=A0A9P7YD97_9HELO|nr:hypothetical protein BJ875DRAFT_134758 [Amylocarpus encephaloides]
MAVAEIIHFPSTSTNENSADDRIQKAIQALKKVENPQHCVLGTQILDRSAIQITSEWDGIEDYLNFSTTPEFSSFIRSVGNLFGEPRNIFHVALDSPAFGPNGPATANVVEFVQVYFPASRVTPDFEKQIEADFSRFEGIFRRAANGDVGLALGWVVEEQEHGDITDEKAKCFFVVRGWESMDLFEQSIKHDAYKEAIPLLLAWNVPFTMWHVERRALGGSEMVA